MEVNRAYSVCYDIGDRALLREMRGYQPIWIDQWIDDELLSFDQPLESALNRYIDVDLDYIVLFLSPEAVKTQGRISVSRWAFDKELATGRVILLPVILPGVETMLDDFEVDGRVAVHSDSLSRGGIMKLAKQLEHHIGGWLSEALRTSQLPRVIGKPTSLTDFSERVLATLAAVPEPCRQEVDSLLTVPFLRSVARSHHGKFRLTGLFGFEGGVVAGKVLVASTC